MKNLITKTEFAVLEGVTRGRVSQWLRMGVIVEIDGKLDWEKSSQSVEEYRNRRRRPFSLADIVLKNLDLSGYQQEG